MFDTIKSYVRNEDFYFIISNNYIYIKGYKKIYEISNSGILIEIDKLYKIKGKNFKLVKKQDDEIKVIGVIESINIT